MNRMFKSKEYKKQKGVVFIITCIVMVIIILLSVLAVDMARLWEIKQTIHTQAQLIAEAGTKLRMQPELEDNADRIQGIVERMYGIERDNNETMGFIRNAADDGGFSNIILRVENDRCNGNRGYFCQISTEANFNKLIFKGVFKTIFNGNGIPISAKAISCYVPGNEDIGLYPYVFEE